MKPATLSSIHLAGRRVDYRLIRSKAAKRLRVRVGPAGVEVVQPAAQRVGAVEAFLHANDQWIIAQLERIERLYPVRRPHASASGEILYRGAPTPVQIMDHAHRQGPAKVIFEQDRLMIIRGRESRTAPAKTLENWLRKQARTAIEQHVAVVAGQLRRTPRTIYIMDQRTRWGSCSSRQNLSFNWRLIMAPEFVLHYLVTHEVVHLAIPDHSKRFWLTVQSLCPETERARQWLCANGGRLYVGFNLER
ncbi:MAG: SprT family zinc-dependent metalloprotease [Candidatus Contendobacter sp.]